MAMIYSHWRWIFYVAGTLACIGAILCRFFLKIETSHLKNEQPSQPSSLILNFCLLIVDSIKEVKRPLLELKWIKHPKPLLGMSMAVTSNIILMLSLFAIQGMLKEIHHVLPEQTLFIYVCMFVGVVISSILCTILYDILGPGLLGFLGSITILTVIVQWMFIAQGMPSSFILILMNITLLTSGVGITIGSGLMGAALGGPLPDLVKRMTVVQFFRFMLNTLSTIVIGWYTTQFSVTGLSKDPSMESSLTYHNILIAALIVNIILSCLSFGLHLTGKGHKLAHKPHLNHETANKNAARS